MCVPVDLSARWEEKCKYQESLIVIFFEPPQCWRRIYTSGESYIVNSGDLRYLNVNIDLFIYCLAYCN